MTEHTKTTIHQFYSAFRNADWNQVRELCHDDIRWRQNPGFPYGGRHLGINAVIKNVFEELRDKWHSFSFQFHSIVADADKAVVIGEYSGRHKVSGKEFQAETAHYFSLKSGKIAEFRQFTDTAVIRAALPENQQFVAPDRTRPETVLINEDKTTAESDSNTFFN